MGINVLSLFDGISCGRVALERAGIDINKYYASEVDEKAIEVTIKHYPNTIQIGDVKELNFKDFKDIDLLIGGSPCQDLSGCNIINKGLEGDRSKLFFEFIKALKTVNPKFYLFENVGSMTNDNMKIISSYFKREPIRINSNLVSPQSRDRYYWTNIPNISIPKDKNIFVKDILEKEVPIKYFLKKDYIYIPKQQKHKSKSGLVYKCGIISKNKWLEDGKNLSRKFSQGNRVYSIYGKSCTINANAGGLGGKSGLYYLEDGKEFSKNNIRRLTPLETERLQNLPDNYTEGLNETNRYKCIGNGWTVDVIAHIFRHLPKEI